MSNWMNDWEDAVDARERWERVEMDTDRQMDALAERDAEIGRLQRLLSAARDGLERAALALRDAGYPHDAAAALDVFLRSHPLALVPSVQPEGGAEPC